MHMHTHTEFTDAAYTYRVHSRYIPCPQPLHIGPAAAPTASTLRASLSGVPSARRLAAHHARLGGKCRRRCFSCGSACAWGTLCPL
jgi:hypothetical protein